MSTPNRRRKLDVRPSAVKAAVAYLLLAVLWVYGTDELLALLTINAHNLIILEKVKGVLFVLFTAASLYFLLRRQERLLGVAAEHQAASVRSATAALQQSEEKNRLLVEQASDGIVVLDAIGKVEQINEKALKILRLTLEQAMGLRYGDVIPDEDQATDPLSMMSMPAGQEIRRDRRFRLPDGSEMLAEISARRLHDGRFLAIFRDVTERRNAEEALRISEERFRTVFQQAPDVIFEIGADGKFVSLNPAFETITGWKIDEWIGRDMLDVIAPESKALAQKTFERHVMEHQQVAPRQEYVLVTKSGKSVLLEVNSEINLVDGRVQQIFGFGRDVTEERHRDLERSRLQTQLEQSERVSGLGRVAATIAHEINNVLMGISPFVDVLRRRPQDAASVAAAASHIAQSVQRGKRVTQDILRFTRAAEPTVRVVDLCQLLERLLATMRPALGAHLQATIECRDSSRALVDAGQMEQVFANLLINARDASTTSGAIEVVVDAAGRELVVELGLPLDDVAAFIYVAVRDHGSGIPSDVLGRVFEPLFTTKRGGTGLGLSIVRQIVTAHGGYIGVTSEPGAGTAFHLFLPRSMREEQRPEAVLHPAPMKIPPETRLLMVEDDTMVAEGILGALGESMVVDVAPTGTSALIALRTFHPDIVILDVSLPDMSGFEVFDHLAKEFPNLPVIFSTGHADESEVNLLRSDHPVRYLLKPYGTDTLMRVIAELLEGAA
jgi:PAS domain S-box-containing protein